jgi:hypothetical protein
MNGVPERAGGKREAFGLVKPGEKDMLFFQR